MRVCVCTCFLVHCLTAHRPPFPTAPTSPPTPLCAAALVCFRDGAVVGRAPLQTFGPPEEVLEELVGGAGVGQEGRWWPCSLIANGWSRGAKLGSKRVRRLAAGCTGCSEGGGKGSGAQVYAPLVVHLLGLCIPALHSTVDCL